MKKLFFVMAFGLLMSGKSLGQGMPVYDNVNFLSFGKQLLEAAKQTDNIIKTVNFLKEQKENIEEVSAAIEKLNAVQELIRNNAHLHSLVQDDLRNILNSPYIKVEEVSRISESFNAILRQASSDLELINEILSSNHLKLTDGERMSTIHLQQQKSKEMVSEVGRKTKRYQEIISFREMQDKINNRETNY